MGLIGTVPGGGGTEPGGGGRIPCPPTADDMMPGGIAGLDWTLEIGGGLLRSGITGVEFV